MASKMTLLNIFVNKCRMLRNKIIHLNFWNGCSHSETSFQTNTNCYFSQNPGETGDIYFFPNLKNRNHLNTRHAHDLIARLCPIMVLE